MIIMELQSAMEYLTTYGWAILIIIIVIVALFELNLFNPNTYAPKAAPGACSVTRNRFGATLSGTCISEIPNFVAQFGGAAGGGINAGILPVFSTVTVTAWVLGGTQAATNPAGSTFHDIVSDGPDEYGTSRGGAYTLLGGEGKTNEFGFGVNTLNGVYITPTSVYQSGTWYFVVGTYSGANVCLYVNGVPKGCGYASGVFGATTALGIGTDIVGGTPNRLYIGSIANVQIYNTSLSSNSIQALYMEGIGGAPINLQNLAGWWPLNDNANDYSGNENNGAATSVFYTASWVNGYTQP
jgi:hypothetical protein